MPWTMNNLVVQKLSEKKKWTLKKENLFVDVGNLNLETEYGQISHLLKENDCLSCYTIWEEYWYMETTLECYWT